MPGSGPLFSLMPNGCVALADSPAAHSVRGSHSAIARSPALGGVSPPGAGDLGAGLDAVAEKPTCLIWPPGFAQEVGRGQQGTVPQDVRAAGLHGAKIQADGGIGISGIARVFSLGAYAVASFPACLLPSGGGGVVIGGILAHHADPFPPRGPGGGLGARGMPGPTEVL